MKNLRYLSYVLRHKWFVIVAGLKLKAPLWNLLVHDLSKFRPDEWKPYADKFFGPDKLNKEFELAWMHHRRRNPHHPEYWADEKRRIVREMPEGVVREMVADWAGAGRAITGEWEVRGWYSVNRGNIPLHPNTEQRVRQLLEKL